MYISSNLHVNSIQRKTRLITKITWITKSSLVITKSNFLNWQQWFFVCILQSVFKTSFVCASNFFVNKNTIEAIQTNSILRLLIAKIIHCKANCICQMCKIEEWFDCLIARERSGSACYEFSKTPGNRLKPQIKP